MSILNTNDLEKKLSLKNNILYQKIGDSVNQFFQNYTSQKHFNEVEKNISDFINTVFNDNIQLSSFLPILNGTYYTYTHSLNVSVYATYLGKHLGLTQNVVEELALSALLHDIGKSKIDETILYKKGQLTNGEFEKIKKHPHYSWEILTNLGVSNKNILSGVRNHHEKLDGTGYPDAKKENEIHVFAKIIAICDAFDALTTDKHHKESYSTFDTLQLMKSEMSTHLDTSIINQLILILRKGTL